MSPLLLCWTRPIGPDGDEIYFFLKKLLFAKSIKARQFIGLTMTVIPERVGLLLGVLKNQIQKNSVLLNNPLLQVGDLYIVSSYFNGKRERVCLKQRKNLWPSAEDTGTRSVCVVGKAGVPRTIGGYYFH